MKSVDTAVIGGGLAGLTAAHELVKAGGSVVVLEARDRVGGRTLNHELSDGTVVELGGQWVGPTQDRVLALAEELGVGLFPSYETGDNLLGAAGQITRWQGEGFGLQDDALADVAEIQGQLEALAETVELDAPWATAGARRLDSQTLDAWLVDQAKTEVGLAFWRMIVPALISAEATQTSLLHFAFFTKSGGMIDRLLSTGGGAQESRIVGGSQMLANALAATLEGAIRLSVPVSAIVQGPQGVEVRYDGGAIRAQRAIVAVPPTLAGRIRYQPELPARRDRLTQQFPMGSVIKVHVAYEEPFWRRDGLSGFVVSLDDQFSVVFDNSPQDLRCGVLLGFWEASAARDAALLSVEQRRDLVLSTLVKYFGQRASDPREYVEQDWGAEEFSRGGYMGRPAPGAWTDYGEALRAPAGRIHFAGSETSAVWNGYMDGAVRSGERAAAEVLTALEAQTPVTVPA